MATSADLLKELEDMGYDIPERLTRQLLGYVLNDSGYFDRIRIYDSRLTDISSRDRSRTRVRIFYKKR